jgi:hypothetical protein
MPDEPIATLGARMRIRHPDGSRLARPGFYLPSDPRHPTTFAGIITSDDQLHYLGPDPTREGRHLASPSFPAKGPQCRMVYFGPHELVLEDGPASSMGRLAT